MKKPALFFLQFFILLFGFVILTALIRLPLTEGRAVNLDLVQIYTDLFILYVYTASIPFFVAFFLAFQLLEYSRKSSLFSLAAVEAIKRIRYCIIVFSLFTFLAGIFILVFNDKEDDPAGFISLCIITILLSTLVAITASVFEKKVRKGIDLKSKISIH
ncbi:MAG TPA: DUF2975 domain-containing protein [Flavobacterium sp.]|nr:DUF2975 domain-containing protein [Flavobacterium sp.]